MKTGERPRKSPAGRKPKRDEIETKKAPFASAIKTGKADSQSTGKSLNQMLEELQPHDHLCLIYESSEEKALTAIPFITLGLKHHEKCLYICDSATADEMKGRLNKNGIDVTSMEKSGQLCILNKIDVYTDKGLFDSDKMISFLIAESGKVVAEKYTALRIVLEMTSVFPDNTSTDKLLEYEAKLNRDFFPRYPCLAIGQYNRNQFDPEIIKGVIMTHPLLVRGGHVYHNFYYVPPEEFLKINRAELEVKHWLDNLDREEKTWESLQKSEEKLNSIFRVAPTGIGMVVNRVLVYANDRFCEMTGYTRDELIGMPPTKIYASLADYEYVGKEKYRQIAEFETGTVETRIRRKDGKVIDVLMSSTPVDSSDLTMGVVFTALDITDYKKAEQALKDEAIKHRILIEQSRDGIVILDQEGAAYETNKQFAVMLGYSEEEVKKLHVWDWEFQFPREQVMQMVTTVDEAGDHFETVHRRKDGSTYNVEISTNGAVIAGQKLIFCVCRDITDRKRAEAALYESEEKYRQLVENSTEAIFIAQDGVVKFANKRTADIMGYPLEEILSKPFTSFIYGNDRQMVMERHLERTRDKDSKGKDLISTYPFRIVCKSGEIKWVEISVIKIEWEGMPATLNFGSDITERKQLEGERQRIDKLESVGTLAGGIAHDFNNILTGILGNISLAILKTQTHNDDINEILKEAEKASLRAKDLTQQLLTFARGGAPIKKLMPINDLIKDTVSFALRGSNVNCQFSIRSDLWQAEIDEGQIGQVISNLVLNARQSMPMGGMIEVGAENITISKGQRPETIAPLQAGDYVRIAITDHGIGIPPQHIDKIFDPYFTTKQAGSGLGLATCYSIIHNHDGHIGVISEVGKGSTFSIFLPASRKEIEIEKFDIKEELLAVKGRILIMDDEKVVTDIAGRMLKYMGYEDVAFAADGDEAIKLYRAAMEAGNPFAVVMLDLTIPGGKGGTETIKELLEIDPEVTAIVSSGYSDNMTMAKYSEYGFKAVVSKPYTIEQLSKTLRQVMTGRHGIV
jgi:two-component system cell cycle sensor histidine kinase/response regulator CckA